MHDISYSTCKNILNTYRKKDIDADQKIIDFYSEVSGISSRFINAIDAIRGMLIRHYYYGNNMIA